MKINFPFSNNEESIKKLLDSFKPTTEFKPYKTKPTSIKTGLTPETFFPSYLTIQQMADNYQLN